MCDPFFGSLLCGIICGMVVLSIVLWLIAVIMVALVGVVVCILCADVWKLASKRRVKSWKASVKKKGSHLCVEVPLPHGFPVDVDLPDVVSVEHQGKVSRVLGSSARSALVKFRECAVDAADAQLAYRLVSVLEERGTVGQDVMGRVIRVRGDALQVRSGARKVLVDAVVTGVFPESMVLDVPDVFDELSN